MWIEMFRASTSEHCYGLFTSVSIYYGSAKFLFKLILILNINLVTCPHSRYESVGPCM